MGYTRGSQIKKKPKTKCPHHASKNNIFNRINYCKYSKSFHCITENDIWLYFGYLMAKLLWQLGAYMCIL